MASGGDISLDRSRRSRRRSQRDDFVVAEDGLPQDIALFSPDIDTSLSIAIVLDVSESRRQELDIVRAGRREYLAALCEGDEVGLVTFGARAQRVADLVTSRTKLLEESDGLVAGGGTALDDGVLEGVRMLETARHRKKVLLLVTDGHNTRHGGTGRSARRAVRQTETLVYALGIGHIVRGSLRARLVAALSQPQMPLLRSFADASGGRAELVDDINGAGRERVVQTIKAFGDELRHQYTIGYYPPAHNGAGWSATRCRLLKSRARMRKGGPRLAGVGQSNGLARARSAS